MGFSQRLVDAALALPGLDAVADSLAAALDRAYAAAGAARQPLKDALNGVWLGHPLHPALTDVPIGAWTAMVALDAIGESRAARAALGIGLLGAAGAAVTGLTDWRDTIGTPRRLGVVHAGLNVGATLLCATSFAVRPRARGLGIALSTAGYALVSLSALFGGTLALDLQIGVNHANATELPEDDVDAGPLDAIPDGGMKRVEGRGYPTLLARRGTRVYALGAVCPHQGGPLDEGTLDLDRLTVTCPWHGSRFRLTDGNVAGGPSAYPAPAFDVRVVDGRVVL